MRLLAALHAHEESSLPLKTVPAERFAVPELAVYDETRRRAELVEREGEPWP